MLPFIAAAVALVGGGVAIYKYFTSDNDQPKQDSGPVARSLGTFVIWGRPDVGKTTLIARLRGLEPAPKVKITTPHRSVYLNVVLNGLHEGPWYLSKIVDMPGTEDRLKDWLSMVATDAHVFYMIDLSRIDEVAYVSRVKLDVAETVKALGASTKAKKRINIIASHVDASKWGGKKNDPNLNNILQSDPEMRALYESLSDVSGYIYSADLTDKASFLRLLQSIVNDCRA